ncbi:MAG: hypothetical protein R3B48_23085 [Kofleriaceae bacterium]
MIFAEPYARWLLVLHTALAVAAVGAATHLALWMRGYFRGQLGRHRAIRRFALLSLGLHAAAFLVGNAMYPAYRVAVRSEYLEEPTAIAADTEARVKIRAEHRGAEPVDVAELTRQRVRGAAQVARWFDVKEHWLALGLFASLALTWLLFRWDPRRDGLELAPIALALASSVALSLWTAAIIGVITSAWRAV